MTRAGEVTRSFPRKGNPTRKVSPCFFPHRFAFSWSRASFRAAASANRTEEPLMMLQPLVECVMLTSGFYFFPRGKFSSSFRTPGARDSRMNSVIPPHERSSPLRRGRNLSERICRYPPLSEIARGDGRYEKYSAESAIRCFPAEARSRDFSRAFPDVRGEATHLRGAHLRISIQDLLSFSARWLRA